MRVDPRKQRAKEDEEREAKILSMLPASHPVARTTPELIRVLGDDRDSVNRALCSLADYRLLEFDGGKTETLRPSLVARSCRRLLGVADECVSRQAKGDSAPNTKGTP